MIISSHTHVLSYDILPLLYNLVLSSNRSVIFREWNINILLTLLLAFMFALFLREELPRIDYSGLISRVLSQADVYIIKVPK